MSDTFERLRFHYFQLSVIDWKYFNYPRLTIHRYKERNGQNELEEITAVKATVASVEMPDGRGGTLQSDINLYCDNASPRAYAALVLEVDRFNSDTKKHWKSLLVPQLNEQIEAQKQVRKQAKKREKKLRKGLDRLLELDMRYVE